MNFREFTEKYGADENTIQEGLKDMPLDQVIELVLEGIEIVGDGWMEIFKKAKQATNSEESVSD